MTVAVLGAGIAGTLTALELAERGLDVHLFERNEAPLTEASYWNEGKLHLGFVYANDRSRRTARRMLRGAFTFADGLARWIGRAEFEGLLSPGFEYVVHRDSMLASDAVEAHFADVAAMFRELDRAGAGRYPGYAGGPLFRRLTAAEIALRYEPSRVLAAYATVERAIETWSVAAHLRGALAAHPRIRVRTGTRIAAVENGAGGFRIACGGARRQRAGPYRSVVNALWANRLWLDAGRGVVPGRAWLNRFKVGTNYRVDADRCAVPTVTLILGRFGDAVVFPTGRAYLSWYPAGLIGMSSRLEETAWPDVLARADLARIERETVAALAAVCPAAAGLGAAACEPPVTNGGAIFAWGETDIDDPHSILHQRYEVGVRSHGAYHTVDTGKYTLGPLFAREAAERIAPRAMACGR